MTRQQRREPVWDELVDVERRTVSLRVFTDPEIYQLEQERIFVRCWLYVAHVSQIPQPGDFVINYMGAEPVLVCRDTSGRLRVFINACRHRGMRLCRTDAGNARTFRQFTEWAVGEAKGKLHHRMLWKYQGWLSGFNGGPLRQPTMRLVDRQMKTLRQGVVASGLEVTTSPDREFFVGRNPA